MSSIAGKIGLMHLFFVHTALVVKTSGECGCRDNKAPCVRWQELVKSATVNTGFVNLA
jgi:hypothetical protein